MKKLSRTGFTILEVLITMTVLSILMLVVFNFMVNGLVQYTTDTNRANLLNSARVGFEVITNDIRLSANADENNRWPDPNAPGGEFGWTSNNNTLVLAAVVEDADGTILFADEAEYISHKNNIVYFVHNGTLYKRIIADPVAGNIAQTTCPATSSSTCPADRTILENVESFTVQYLDDQDQEVNPSSARSIRLTALLSKTDFGRDVKAGYTTRMVFRND